MGKTLVLGAGVNPSRYSSKAIQLLWKYGFDFVPVGMKHGEVGGKPIIDIRTRPALTGVDVITLYMNPVHQKDYYEYMIGLKPGYIIFNPGTENPELKSKAADAGIKVLEACTIVLIQSGIYEKFSTRTNQEKD